jgi:hypothetical protein
MKIFKNIAIICLVTLMACGDEHEFFPQISDVSSRASIKFIHAASDTVGMNLFIDDIKVTGNSSSIITSGTVNVGQINIGSITYSNSFPITGYAAISQTNGLFSVIFPATYTTNNTALSKVMVTKQSGSLNQSSFYSIVFVGVTAAYEAVVLDDNLTSAPIDNKAYIRLGNFIHNSTNKVTLKGTPPPTGDDPTPVEITIFPSIEFKLASEFFALPRTGTYTGLKIVDAVTNATIATATSANSNFANNKVYTLIARGQIGKTGAQIPTLSRVINR